MSYLIGSSARTRPGPAPYPDSTARTQRVSCVRAAAVTRENQLSIRRMGRSGRTLLRHSSPCRRPYRSAYKVCPTPPRNAFSACVFKICQPPAGTPIVIYIGKVHPKFSGDAEKWIETRRAQSPRSPEGRGGLYLKKMSGFVSASAGVRSAVRPEQETHPPDSG